MKYCIKLFCCLRPYMVIFEQNISTHAKKRRVSVNAAVVRSSTFQES